MKLTVLENGHEYFATLFRADDRIKSLTKEISSDIPWMGKWKLSSRKVDYENVSLAQKRGVHRLFDWTNHRMTCSCGFSLPDMASKDEFYAAPGHIDLPSQSLTTFFVVRFLDDDKDDSLKFFCQKCGPIAQGASEAEDKPDHADARAEIENQLLNHSCPN